MSEQTIQPDELIEAVADFVDAGDLIAPKQAVLVAVSGGADSVALLAILRELAARPERAWRLTAAHLNHRLRADAPADAEFVAELAERWNIPCIVESRDVAAEAAAGSESIETAARRVRYAFLTEAAERCGADAVAVGHHADDNVETILHRIVRGTHLRGLAGIPAGRSLDGGPVQLVRPLLAVRREEIEAFCGRRDLPWRTDPTNADVGIRRNFIRHELLPLLRARLNPRADEALLRLAEAADDVEAWLDRQGRDLLDEAWREEDSDPPARAALAADVLAHAHAVPRRHALRAALERIDAPMGKLTAEQLADLADLPAAEPPAAVALPGRRVARREGELLILESAAGPAAEPWELPLACPGEVRLPDGRVLCCTLGDFDRSAFDAHCARRPEGVELLDADALRGPLTCRPRRDGDAFAPLGTPGRASVGDFLTDLKLPRHRRDGVLCIADAEGIVYVAPLRIADRVKVAPATARTLRIELRQPPHHDG